MLIAPALQAVLDAAKTNPSHLTQLELSFADPSMNTMLRLQDGLVTGMRSELLPPWSTSLLAAGVHPATIAEAQQQGGSRGSALTYLLQGGYITQDQLALIAHERTFGALLPLAWHNAMTRVTPVAAAAQPLPGSSDAQAAAQAAEQFAVRLTSFERQLRPSDQLQASPLQTPTGPGGTTADQVYRAALRGMPLGEMARRLPQRWDHLTRTVSHLVTEGALRAPSARPARAVAEQLKVGDMAPDFCLPDMAGGERRLSDLRGRPVWLVFNRQSTCALCNPHNAQIIAMHDRMRAQGVQVVTIWGSTVADLEEGIGRMRPPYPVLSDPQDETYDRYGLTFSLLGTLDGRNMPTLVQGFKMMGTKALKSDGELLRMPAEFLIGPDGRIERAHYNSFGADWLPVEDVLAWSAQHATEMT